MIYDVFLFRDEIELLDLRLRTLGDVVDRFVLVESTKTFKGDDKPMSYEENQHLFRPYRDRIIHVVVSDTPEGPYFTAEFHQRRSCVRGLQWSVRPDDLILFGDADEIAHPNYVRALDLAMHEPVAFNQRLYVYWPDCLQVQPWNGTIAFKPEHYNGIPDLQWLRVQRNNLMMIGRGRQAGWHFASLGPLASLQGKLQAFDISVDEKVCGNEVSVPGPDDVERLNRCLETGEDLCNRPDDWAKKEFVPIIPGETHPEAIMDWLDRWPHKDRPGRITH